MADEEEDFQAAEEGELDGDGQGPGPGGRLIAVGGGRGGIGKSIMAESLAVYFAQLGKPVVLVDADPTANIWNARRINTLFVDGNQIDRESLLKK